MKAIFVAASHSARLHRGTLVVAEVALAVVLVTRAGLLIKSLMALHKVESRRAAVLDPAQVLKADT